MKALACAVVAVAALVVSLPRPAGAGFPDDGKIILKNKSSFTLNISRTEDEFFLEVAPGRTFKLTNVNRYEGVPIDFDVDNDTNVDTTYVFDLDGNKVAKFTIGDLGILSLSTQQ